MPPRDSARSVTNETIQQLTDKAKRSPDALFVEDSLRTIALSAADSTHRATAVEEISRAHWNTTNVVVASLTILSTLDATITRRLCHDLLAERFHVDRDIILARAATALIELSPPEASDIPFIVRALTTRIDRIQADTKRALCNVLPTRALAILAVARSGANQNEASPLIRLLEEKISNGPVQLPPRPVHEAQHLSPKPPKPRPQVVRLPPRRSPQKEVKPSSDIRKPVLEKKPPHEERSPSPSAPSQTQSPEHLVQMIKELRSSTMGHLSLTELKSVANFSKDHRAILSSIAEVLFRFGRSEAGACMNGYVWAISDPANPLKAAFATLAEALFSDDR
jgi:hypothetical protein